MSLGALAARTPAMAAAAPAATTPGGAAAGAGAPGDGDNAFAALLAGLGEPAPAAAAADVATALTAALTGDAGPAAAEPALSAAVPDPLAGMALLMAQFTPAATAATVALPGATAGASQPSAAAALGAAPGPDLPAAPGIARSAPACMLAQPAPDLPGATGFPVADTPALPALPELPALGALSVDVVQAQAVADTPGLLQAVPDIASLAAGWAAAPTPAAAQGPAAAAPVYQAELPSRPGDAGFAGDLAAQVTVLVEGGFQQAQLRLNPAELGPIQIQLSVSAQTNTADISFSAVHGLTRESIEQALPELREMLQAQGLSLGQTGVSGGQQQPGDGRDNGAAQARAARPGAAAGTDGAGVDAGLQGLGLAAAPRATRGMLDLYA